MRIDKSVNDCLNELKESLSPKTSIKVLSMFYVGYLSIPIYVIVIAISQYSIYYFNLPIKILLIEYEKPEDLFMTISLYLLIIAAFIMISVFRNVLSRNVNEEKLLGNAKTISTRLKMINNFVWGVLLFTLVLLMSVDYNNLKSRHVIPLTAIALFWIIFPYSIKSELRLKIKRPLISKYRDSFPILNVFTGEREYNGRLENLFDKEALRLRNDFGVVIIPWNNVKVVLINENNGNQLNQNVLQTS